MLKLAKLPKFTESGANNCVSVIFRDEYEELQNDGLDHRSTY